MKLTNKVALVTGASKGIGASIAKHLAQEGATVIVNYSTSKEGAERVVEEIKKAGGKAIAIQADLAKTEDLTRLFDETEKAFGHLDILVNNAGIYEFAPLHQVTEDHFHKQFNLNVLSLILATQKAVELFGKEGGSVINISSIVSRIPMQEASIYSATKAAVDAITKSLAQELGPKNIRVNSINPGMIDTEGLQKTGIAASDFRTKVEHETPLGRIGKPEDVGKVAVFLASDDSGWVTGETLMVAGGQKG